ncbi:MAG TPA: hypothetical protein VGV36_06370 [Solirubrobacteraceae bacterium]|nr:hypothetical protein [Solirubrobacteraceae bacterium]
MQTRRLLPLSALVALALAPGAAQAHDTAVATLERPSEVRELDGTVVFSAFDRALDAYRLTVHDAQGARALAVQPSPTPFEADIGTNSKGERQVIFSLDVGRQEGGQAGGRDLFVLTLASGKVRPVRNANTNRDERAPTIDEGRIAFTRVYDEAEGTREDKPVVYTKRLVAPRERPSTRLPGVPRRRDGRVTTDRSVSELELENGRLGQIVRFTYETAAGFLTNEVRQVELDDRSSRRVGTLTTGLNGQFYVGLSFAEGYLAWYETSIAGNDSAGAYRYRPGRGYRYAEGPPHLSGFAWEGDGAWQVRCRADGVVVGEDRDAPCTLVHVEGLEWRVIDGDRVR